MKVLYTGSFNPFHKGHEYVYNAACKYFGKDSVWIGIGINADKKSNIDLNVLKFSIVPITKNVITYFGLTSDVVKNEKFDLLIRGIRPGHSLDDENDLLYWNHKLCGVDTILIPTPTELNHISSSAIRLFANNKDIDISEYMNMYVFNRWNRYTSCNNFSNINCKTIYFGKCCSGKSTFLHSVKYGLCREYDNVFDVDSAFWNYFKLSSKYNSYSEDEIKKCFKTAFYDRNTEAYNFYIDIIGRNIDWKTLLNENRYFDMPVVGTYFKYIPIDLLCMFKLVKISTSEENRGKFAEKRKVNKKLIECNDYFYIDPPFYDKEIVIE